MGHLLTMLFFAALLAGAGALIARMLRDDAERILDALAMTAPSRPARPWPARARSTNMGRPAAIRSAGLRATA